MKEIVSDKSPSNKSPSNSGDISRSDVEKEIQDLGLNDAQPRISIESSRNDDNIEKEWQELEYSNTKIS